jgi:hypothetical protein
MSESDQNSPAIVPEMLQHIAAELGIAGRLDINWGSTTTDAVGLYMGVLAGINVVATTIADKNNRSTPTYQDYIAAIWSWCMWPPNKPPFIQEYWAAMSGAFYSATIREKLKAAVGPRTVALANELRGNALLGKSLEPDSQIEDKAKYFETVFNPTTLGP